MNIGNPSIERAERQSEWLSQRSEDIFVLTETKNSVGCHFLADVFSGMTVSLFQKTNNSYQVLFPQSLTGDLGTMIISKLPVVEQLYHFEETSIYHAREISASIMADNSVLIATGLYVPSRDASTQKIKRKQLFVEDFISIINKSPSDVIIGDFNIVEPQHVPHYSTFFQWEYDFYDILLQYGYVDAFRKLHPQDNEYSWVGRTNNGYRYDHCFVNSKYADRIVKCEYDHETRLLGLTDHSAITVTLSL